MKNCHLHHRGTETQRKMPFPFLPLRLGASVVKRCSTISSHLRTPVPRRGFVQGPTLRAQRPNAVRPYDNRHTPEGRTPLAPLAVPATLPHIVIGGWDDEDKEFSVQKQRAAADAPGGVGGMPSAK